MDKRKALIAVFAVIVIIVASVYLFISDSGGGNGNGKGDEISIHSADVTMEGYLQGQFEGGIRVRARELNRENPDVRMKIKEVGDVVILNNEGPSYYIYQSDSDTWVKAPENIATEAFYSLDILAANIQEWASEGGEGTHEFDYQGTTVNITINEINPDLSDELFQPPEDANVENMIP